MKHFIQSLILLFFVFSSINVPAQHIVWERTYGGSNGESSYDIEETMDGGYIVVGYSYSSDQDVESGNYGNADYWVVKLNKEGAIEWERTYGGTGTDQANAVQQTNDGGYIIAGYSSSDDEDLESGNYGDYDYWVVKLNATGDIIWEQNYGGSQDDRAEDIVQTTDGGYIVAGYSTSSDNDVSGNLGFNDFWIVKLDTVGEITWEHYYGGTKNEIPYSIEQTVDGGYIVAGYTASSDFDVIDHIGFPDYWVLKLGQNGLIDWARSYGGGNQEYAYSIQQTKDGGYILGGRSGSDDGDVSGNYGPGNYFDYWIVKLDYKGDIIWENHYGGNEYDECHSVSQTKDGGYLLTGFSESDNYNVSSGNYGETDYWVVKIDDTGTIEWEQHYGGSGIEKAYSAIETSDGAFVIAGYTSSEDNDVSDLKGDADFWLTRLCMPTTNTISRTVCDSYTVPSGTSTYTESGTYTDIVPNKAGCDSIITVELTVNKAVADVLQDGNIFQAAAYDVDHYQWGKCEDGFTPNSRCR